MNFKATATYSVILILKMGLEDYVQKDFLPASIKAVRPFLHPLVICRLILALLSSNNFTTSLWPYRAAKNKKSN